MEVLYAVPKCKFYPLKCKFCTLGR